MALHSSWYQDSYSLHPTTQVPPVTFNRHIDHESLTRMPPFRLPPAIILLIFLPIPPLLSLLYLITGHAILRQAYKSSPSSIYHTPIFPSLEAGATGGLILTLPILLLLYFLIFYHKQRSVPEDFFEDDDSVTTASVRWGLMYLAYLAGLLFFVGIGGIAGPLGVTCLSGGILKAFVSSKKMLSTGAATAAGFVGGAVLSVAILLLGLLIALVWVFWVKRKNPPQ